MYYELWEIHCHVTRLVEVLEGFGTHLWDIHNYLLKISMGCTPVSVGHIGYIMYYDLWEIHCYVTRLVEILEGFGTHLWDMHSYLFKTSVGYTPLSVGHTGYMMYYDLWEIHCHVT